MIITFFFFNDTATTEIYTLSLHDALPIYLPRDRAQLARRIDLGLDAAAGILGNRSSVRSEEHTSELQSHLNIVCRLLLEKKKLKYSALKQHHSHSHLLNSTPNPAPPHIVL